MFIVIIIFVLLLFNRVIVMNTINDNNNYFLVTITGVEKLWKINNFQQILIFYAKL